jgi:tetratricopeptide (TPR) repeat protein
MYRFNAHDNAVATHLFTRAVDADPGFARAYAGLSFTHFQNAFVGFTGDNEEQRRLTRMYAEQSLELDPLDPFANLTVGRAHQLGGDLEGAVGWFERAIELNPNYAFAIYNRSLVDALSSRGAEAEAGTVRALALSPLDPLQYAMLGSRALSHIVRGDFAAARSWAERAATAPNAHVQLRVIAAFAHELAGDRVGAQRWATVLRRSGSGYARETFFAAFPFRDDAVAAAVAGALDRLGL